MYKCKALTFPLSPRGKTFMNITCLEIGYASDNPEASSVVEMLHKQNLFILVIHKTNHCCGQYICYHKTVAPKQQAQAIILFSVSWTHHFSKGYSIFLYREPPPKKPRRPHTTGPKTPQLGIVRCSKSMFSQIKWLPVI